MIDYTEKLAGEAAMAYLRARGVLADPAAHSVARIRRSAKIITSSQYADDAEVEEAKSWLRCLAEKAA